MDDAAAIKAAIDLVRVEKRNDSAGIRQVLPDEQTKCTRGSIEFDELHGAALLFPQHQRAS